MTLWGFAQLIAVVAVAAVVIKVFVINREKKRGRDIVQDVKDIVE